MAYKSTVAIIGATSTLGKTLAMSVVSHYRLLLMDDSVEDLTALQNELGQHETAVEIIQCCKEASWEADAVVVVVDDEKLPAIAEKVKVVTTCKPVVHFTTAEKVLLQDFLPHADVVTVWLDNPNATNIPPQSAFLKSTGYDALTFAQSLLTAVGCSLKTEVPRP